jgi:hypothetical protein
VPPGVRGRCRCTTLPPVTGSAWQCPTPPPTPHRRSTLGGQTPFSFSFFHRKIEPPPASRRSDRPFLDSFRLDHRQGSSVLLPQFSQLELVSSGPRHRSCCRRPPSVSERSPSCFSSPVALLKGYLISSTSSCS